MQTPAAHCQALLLIDLMLVRCSSYRHLVLQLVCPVSFQPLLLWPGGCRSCCLSQAACIISSWIVSFSCCSSSDVGLGYYSELANQTGALQIWPEHRYYANEAPYFPDDNYEHLNVEQALIDHVEVVLHVQKLLGMDQNPVIAIGGSYGKQSFPAVISAVVMACAMRCSYLCFLITLCHAQCSLASV